MGGSRGVTEAPPPSFAPPLISPRSQQKKNEPHVMNSKTLKLSTYLRLQIINRLQLFLLQLFPLHHVPFPAEIGETSGRQVIGDAGGGGVGGKR